VQGRRIILTRIDSHSILVSRAVLALLPSPLPTSIEGGAIVRSPTTGEPTGLFLDNAMKLVFAVRGKPTEDEMNRRLARVARDAVSKGLVGVHDAGTSPAEVAFYTACVASGLSYFWSSC
jgi:predicted amidohydrolase YtcJ